MKKTNVCCLECGGEFNAETCDLEHDNSLICPCCPGGEPERSYEIGYAHACGYRD